MDVSECHNNAQLLGRTTDDILGPDRRSKHVLRTRTLRLPFRLFYRDNKYSQFTLDFDRLLSEVSKLHRGNWRSAQTC